MGYRKSLLSKAKRQQIAQRGDHYDGLVETVLNRLDSITEEHAELIAGLTAQAARIGALAAMGADVERDKLALKAAASNLAHGELHAIRETVMSWVQATVVAAITDSLGDR
jgi:hypothetical protein